jgi:hypothetical protein
MPLLKRLIACHSQDVDGDEEMGDAEGGGEEENGKKRKVIYVFSLLLPTHYNIVSISERATEILW